MPQIEGMNVPRDYSYEKLKASFVGRPIVEHRLNMVARELSNFVSDEGVRLHPKSRPIGVAYLRDAQLIRVEKVARGEARPAGNPHFINVGGALAIMPWLRGQGGYGSIAERQYSLRVTHFYPRQYTDRVSVHAVLDGDPADLQVLERERRLFEEFLLLQSESALVKRPRDPEQPRERFDAAIGSLATLRTVTDEARALVEMYNRITPFDIKLDALDLYSAAGEVMAPSR